MYGSRVIAKRMNKRRRGDIPVYVISTTSTRSHHSFPSLFTLNIPYSDAAVKNVNIVVKVCSFSNKFLVPLLLIPISNRTSGSKIESSPPSHEIFKYLVPLLFAAVATKCQVKNEDPFEARPINMWCFVIATIIYGIALGIMERNKNHVAKYLHIIDHVILVSGALSSVSLLSVLLPCGLGFLSFAVMPFVLIIIAWNKLKRGCCWLYDRATRYSELVHLRQHGMAAQPNPSLRV
ncbi:unnamed protein product [Ilex paraguariensis]|uniref:Uncharacterized protein n=1 Tax=Ilex paraguariensis TaxID=185542 RepID=A0ABC8SQB0_9AQUA